MFIDPKTPQPTPDMPVTAPERPDDAADADAEQSAPRSPRSFKDWIALGYLPG